MRMFVATVAASLLLAVPLCASNSGNNNRTLLEATASSQAIQNARADAFDLSRMQNISMIRRFHRAGYLVTVPSSTHYYYLHGIPSSYRYLRPWSKLFLDRLSRQYYAQFKQRLRVTSMVRTVALQRRLTRRNANAALATGPHRSSHLTGATLDISTRFMGAAGRRWMRSVLYKLEKAGYLYAIEEFYQPTFHIMVYPTYRQYVARITGEHSSSGDEEGD